MPWILTCTSSALNPEAATSRIPRHRLSSACVCSQGNAAQASDLRQSVQQLQQQLYTSKASARQNELQLQQQVQQLQHSSSDKENSLVQLQQQCQSTKIQLQVSTAFRLVRLMLDSLYCKAQTQTRRTSWCSCQRRGSRQRYCCR